MLQRGKLPLPNLVLHFHNQSVSHQHACSCVSSDLFSGGVCPDSSDTTLRIGQLWRKFYVSKEASGAFHVCAHAGGSFDCSMRLEYRMGKMDLILASQSPRRSELLRNAGFAFQVRARPVEERRAAGELPQE